MKNNRQNLSDCKLDHTPDRNESRDDFENVREQILRSNAVRDFGPWGEHDNIENIAGYCSHSVDYSLTPDQIEKLAQKLGRIRIEDSK